ncbi:hypothetical protein PVAG01_04234 [Phlyctema vagabunda]|uniref:Transposase Tc1-like domain-containing protein n=1 Tax=Phlyctema vagabunda TaxID=108571 RepID=A0ABR4PNM5_9HELO
MERPATPPAQTGAIKELTRDQRIEIRTLRSIGWKYRQIVDFFKGKDQSITFRQIYHASTTQATPKKRPGRPPVIIIAQIEELIYFISLSKKNRRLPLWRLAIELEWEGIGVSAIKSALRRIGYKRYVALRKPPISEKNARLRLKFALEYVNWTDEQWDEILWSDETWVTPGSYRKTYVTRNKDEALDPTCILERERKKKGWMFWGCFSGKSGKGPGIF